jgi:hypothetical protein
MRPATPAPKTLWCRVVAAVMPRSLRGRPSQLKGAFGVANAMPLTRHPGPASLHDPSGQHHGQATALPSTTRGTTAATHAHSTTTPKNNEDNNTQRPKPRLRG